MSPVIRVSDDVYIRLQAIAIPFEDTPASVIQRLLEEHERIGKKSNDVVAASGERADAVPPAPLHQSSVHALPRHPSYAQAHRGSQLLHDQLVEAVTKQFHATVHAESVNLVFKAPRNFAAIQRLAIRSPCVDVSIFGRVGQFEDPKHRLKAGRFPHWSAFQLTSQDDMAYALQLISQAHQIRLRGRQ